MKHILALSLAVSLSGCATLPPSAPTLTEGAVIAAEIAAAPKADRLKLAPAVATEVGARFRCPRNPVELDLLSAARLSFDLWLRGKVSEQSSAIVDRLRLATNAACGISPVAPQ